MVEGMMKEEAEVLITSKEDNSFFKITKKKWRTKQNMV